MRRIISKQNGKTEKKFSTKCFYVGSGGGECGDNIEKKLCSKICGGILLKLSHQTHQFA